MCLAEIEARRDDQGWKPLQAYARSIYWSVIWPSITSRYTGFIATTVAYLIYRRQRNKEEITRQILDDLSIVSKMHIEEGSIGKQIENRLKIVFDGKSVEDLRVVSLKVWNSGSVDAEIWNSKDATTGHRDFETPIGFEFPGRQVVSGKLRAYATS